MSINGILNSASTGLAAAQMQLRVLSNNVENVNTPGYVREVVQQEPLVSDGVLTEPLALAANAFLQSAALSAQAQSGGAAVAADLLGRSQAVFGDPGSQTGYFSQLDQMLGQFGAINADSTATAARRQAVAGLQNFLSQSAGMAQQVTKLSAEADSRIGADAVQANDLLGQIDKLNQQLIVANHDDTTPALRQQQSQLIDQLSKLLDVQVVQRSDGGVDIRGTAGMLLLGRGGASTFSYLTTGSAAHQLVLTDPGGAARQYAPAAGELNGLLRFRNSEAPNLSAQLGEYVTKAAQAINATHNAAAAVPPPSQLTGRNTGMDLATIVGGFSGAASIAITDPAGVLQHRVDINFTAGTLALDGGGPTAFTPASFLGVLNGALGPGASASFSNGRLTLQTAGATGLAVADSPTTPARRGGMGFSQFFGLNDLVVSNTFAYPNTGLASTDANGFAGGALTLRVADGAGSVLQDTAIAIPSGGTIGGVVAALNDPVAGLGKLGQFALNANGELNFTPSVADAHLQVLGDTTQWTGGGASLSVLFGLDGSQRAARAQSFSVRPDIVANSANLAVGQLNTSASPGQSALAVGDTRGALDMTLAGQTAVAFSAAGLLPATAATLAQYGAELAGGMGQRAASATSAKANYDALAQQATTQRASVEGVNLDEELAKLTTYQHAYAASARLIQVAGDLLTTLLNIQ